MLGHFSVLLSKEARRVLSVGFGSGQTTRCLALHGLEAIDCVEIAPEVVDVALEYFPHINLGPQLGTFVNMIYADAKNYLHLTDRKYDVIINDSIHPRDFADNASLYTVDYFTTAARRLRPGGQVISWLPIYHMSDAVFRSLLGTAMESFQHVTLWYLTVHPAPLVLVAGSEDPQLFSPAAIDGRLAAGSVAESLADLNIRDSRDVLVCYIADELDLAGNIGPFRINSDHRPFVEFDTGRNVANEEIFSRFVLGLRSDSLERHLDFSGFDDAGRLRWLRRYRMLWEASTHLLAAQATANPEEKLAASLRGLALIGDNPALLAAKADAEKRLFAASVNLTLAGSPDRALELAGRVLSIDRVSSTAWIIRSAALLHSGRRAEALSCARKAAELDPGNPDAHFAVGTALLTARSYEGAAAEFDEALRLTVRQPGDHRYRRVQILEALAKAHELAGNRQKADRALKDARDLAPDHLKRRGSAPPARVPE
jgi:tetratricopeptide (TPR) repeat protein